MSIPACTAESHPAAWAPSRTPSLCACITALKRIISDSSLRCCISSNSHNAFSHSLILKVCIRCVWWWLFCKMFLTDEFLDLKGDHVCFWTPIACPGIIATKNRGPANYFWWYWAKNPSDVSTSLHSFLRLHVLCLLLFHHLFAHLAEVIFRVTRTYPHLLQLLSCSIHQITKPRRLSVHG